MALEDPSVSELIRDIDERTRRMEASLGQFVPTSLYTANREADLRRIGELEAKANRAWALVAAPVIVGVLIWLLTSGVAK